MKAGRPRRFTDAQIAELCGARAGRATISDAEAGRACEGKPDASCPAASRSLFQRWRIRAGIRCAHPQFVNKDQRAPHERVAGSEGRASVDELAKRMGYPDGARRFL